MTRALSYFLLLACLTWLATLGSWEILRGESLGVAYDSLAANLLRGSAEVDVDAIQFERYEQDGRIFMYFGPFPAILRIALHHFAPDHYGAWSRVSTVLAVFLSAIIFSRLVSGTLSLNRAISSSGKHWLTLAAPFVLTLGTPLAFILSSPNIYHEAVAWGFCGTLLSLKAVVDLAIYPKKRANSMHAFAIGFGIALLSRLTNAIPALFLMPFVLVRYIKLELSQSHSKLIAARKLAIPSGMILACCLFQLWYNYARFGSVFVFRNISKYFFSKTHLGPDFSISRLPDALTNYFGVSGDLFLKYPPFVRMLTAVYQRPELFVAEWREQAISLSLSSSWLLLTGFVGVLYAFIRPCQPLMRVALVATLLEATLIMTYFFITQRYAVEIAPFFIIGLCVFLSHCRLTRVPLTSLLVTSMLSILITMTSTLRFNLLTNASIPLILQERLSWLFFPKIQDALRDTNATFVSDLPGVESPPPATLAYPNIDLFGRPLRLLRYTSVKGLGMRVGSSVSYHVPPNMTEFHAVAMLSDMSVACNETSLTFEGRNETGALLFRQEIRSNTPEPIAFSAALRGSRSITISLRDEIKRSFCDEANLYLARFTSTRFVNKTSPE
jgi:hypothetical protein